MKIILITMLIFFNLFGYNPYEKLLQELKEEQKKSDEREWQSKQLTPEEQRWEDHLKKRKQKEREKQIKEDEDKWAAEEESKKSIVEKAKNFFH